MKCYQRFWAALCLFSAGCCSTCGSGISVAEPRVIDNAVIEQCAREASLYAIPFSPGETLINHSRLMLYVISGTIDE